MVNDLGDELRADCDRKYVQLPTFEDDVRKNEDEHKDMQQDINHICIRLKLIEDWKTDKEARDAKSEVTLGKVDKAAKKHETQLEEIIF